MLAPSTWWILMIAQLMIFLLAGIAVLAWVFWRRRRTAPEETAPPSPSECADVAIRRFFESELTRTRAQLEENDRDLPEHVLQLRVNYLQGELEGLDYDGEPGRFWSHICDRIDHWIARQQEATRDSDASQQAHAAADNDSRDGDDLIADDEYVR